MPYPFYLFTPFDGVPYSFMKKIKHHFGDQFYHTNGEGQRQGPCHDPRDDNGIDGTHNPPANGFCYAPFGAFGPQILGIGSFFFTILYYQLVCDHQYYYFPIDLLGNSKVKLLFKMECKMFLKFIFIL
jgi:hypothetical protein